MSRINLFALFLIPILLCGCSDNGPQRVIGQNIFQISWSRNGSALFYTTESGICRYEVKDGRRKFYRIPDQGLSDISSDETTVVSIDCNLMSAPRKYKIISTNLSTNTKFQIYSSERELEHAYWMNDNSVLFAQKRVPTRYDDNGMMVDPYSYGVANPDYLDIFLIHLGSKPTKIQSEVRNPFYARDGSSLVYIGSDDFCHLYDLKKKTNRVLGIHGLKFIRHYIHFLYLSKNLLIYNIIITDTNKRSQEDRVEVLDLRNMKIQQIYLPNTASAMELSPDLTRYWFIGEEHQDTSPQNLYLEDIPKETVQVLAAFEKSSK